MKKIKVTPKERKILLALRNKQKSFIVFDCNNPPVDGDSITVGNMKAVFSSSVI